MTTTHIFSKNVSAFNAGYRAIVNKGSTRSSKTWSILQLLYTIAFFSTRPRVISIVSESLPHLKKGCIRDFRTMLENEGIWDENDWNATDKFYKVGKCTIEFFGVDTPAKVHGPARDILYINECINIEYETYRQLAIRTTETIFLDYNPCFEFWVDEKVLPLDGSTLIHSTYKDNNMLTAAQVKEIESNRDSDPDWWRVYGLGETGSMSGLIVKNWDIVPVMPESPKKRFIGVDFGYTNDPTAIVDIMLSEGEIWIDEIAYGKQLDNPEIARIIIERAGKNIPVVADSAEPKSIAEIRKAGIMIEPAQKGADSVNMGIGVMNRYRKHVTQRSLNIIKEYRNYRYVTDANGDATNKPIDKFNHSIDAQRYVFINKFADIRGEFAFSIVKY
jgi:phage terminase large subunit